MIRIRAFLGRIRRLPKQTAMDYKNSRLMKTKQQIGKKIYYFGVPEHSNLGDLAQCFCIRKYLEKYFPEYEVTEVFTRNYLDNSFGIRDYLKTTIKPNDIIFFRVDIVRRTWEDEKILCISL